MRLVLYQKYREHFVCQHEVGRDSASCLSRTCNFTVARGTRRHLTPTWPDHVLGPVGSCVCAPPFVLSCCMVSVLAAPWVRSFMFSFYCIYVSWGRGGFLEGWRAFSPLPPALILTLSRHTPLFQPRPPYNVPPPPPNEPPPSLTLLWWWQTLEVGIVFDTELGTDFVNLDLDRFSRCLDRYKHLISGGGGRGTDKFNIPPPHIYIILPKFVPSSRRHSKCHPRSSRHAPSKIRGGGIRLGGGGGGTLKEGGVEEECVFSCP
jgi:hypothetical protein